MQLGGEIRLQDVKTLLNQPTPAVVPAFGHVQFDHIGPVIDGRFAGNQGVAGADALRRFSGERRSEPAVQYALRSWRFSLACVLVFG